MQYNTLNVPSPVTKTGRTELVETIPVSMIVEEYQKLLGADVSEYFVGLDEIAIFKCLDTGFRFYYPSTIFADEKFYTFLQGKSFYYSSWLWEHQKAMEKIPSSGKILEVGCGTGSFIERLSKKGYDCTGLELNDAAVQVCREKGLKVYNELLDKHLIENAGTYDVVCAFQVLEHVYDVNSFITECIKCLKPGGKLIFAVPNNFPYYSKYDKYNTLNMPPHHSGLWNTDVFGQLPSFFPLKADFIKAEPLFDRHHFLNVYLKHKKMEGLRNMINKIRPGIVSRLLWPVSWFVEGRSVVAMFIKTADQ